SASLAPGYCSTEGKEVGWEDEQTRAGDGTGSGLGPLRPVAPEEGTGDEGAAEGVLPRCGQWWSSWGGKGGQSCPDSTRSAHSGHPMGEIWTHSGGCGQNRARSTSSWTMKVAFTTTKMPTSHSMQTASLLVTGRQLRHWTRWKVLTDMPTRAPGRRTRLVRAKASTTVRVWFSTE